MRRIGLIAALLLILPIAAHSQPAQTVQGVGTSATPAGGALSVNCVSGCGGGGGPASNVAVTAPLGSQTSAASVATTVNSSALPAGASTSALQTSVGATAHTDSGIINTTLGTPMQATGGTVGIVNGANQAAVKAASTPPLATDPALVVVLSPNSSSSSAPVSVTVNAPPNDVLTGPTSLTGAGDVTVNTQGSGAAALQVTGTFTGLSGVIRGSVDGTNYVNVGAYNANSGAVITSGTTLTATGIYVIPAAGYRTLQFHVTAVSTGTAVINLNSSAGALDPPSSVSGGGKTVNLTGINGATPLTGNGVTGSGSPRVTISSDQTAFSVNSTNQTQTDTVMIGGVNVKEINAVTPLMGNGVSGTGSQRVNIASDNTAFSVNAQPTPVTSGGLSVKSFIVANNTTSVAVDASAGQIYGITGSSISAATPVWAKFYNASQGSTTCGSGTPVQRELIPAPGVSGGGTNISIPLGIPYSTAITVCVTAGIADNDTTSPAASSYILNVYYK